MKKALLLLGIGISLFFSIQGAIADTIVNGGFESGTFTGWAVSNADRANVVMSYQTENEWVPSPYNFTPRAGNYFAQVMGGPQEAPLTTISQTFYMNTGSTLSGYAGFQSNDSYNDYAYVKLNGTQLWYKECFFHEYVSIPWEQWTWTATQSGFYTLEFGVVNYEGAGSWSPYWSSVALFDVIINNSPPPVPEPGTMLLLGSGLIGFLGYGRKMIFKPDLANSAGIRSRLRSNTLET